MKLQMYKPFLNLYKIVEIIILDKFMTSSVKPISFLRAIRLTQRIRNTLKLRCLTVVIPFTAFFRYLN